MLNGKSLLLISLLLFANTIGLFLFEFNNPNALGDYQNNTVRLTDFYSAMILFGASAYILMSLAKRYYLSEYKKARESERLKSSFLANLSHEIRTPLNSIVGFSSVLTEADSNFNEKEREKIGAIIKNSSNSLLRLINDVLDVSRIEAGQMSVKQQEFCVNDLIDNLKEVYSLILVEKQKAEVNIETKLPPGLVFITSDMERINQVMINLLDNAVKFTGEGVITLGFNIENSLIHFFVSDTGIGVKEEFKDSLFDRFFKVEDDNDMLYRGVGIGLYLSKKIVELLGGNIWFDSEFGNGSEFHFIIPANELFVEEKEMNKINHLEGNDQSFGNSTILIVEDDLASMELLKQILKNKSPLVLGAANGVEALDVVKSNPNIDLILLDIRLPDINGFDLLVKIREILPKVPIIAQTAFAMAGDEKKCHDAGFDDYLSKPILREVFLKKLEKYLEIH